MLERRFGTRWAYLSKSEVVVVEFSDELVTDLITKHNCSAQVAGSAPPSFFSGALLPTLHLFQYVLALHPGDGLVARYDAYAGAWLFDERYV